MGIAEKYRPAPYFTKLGDGFADVVAPARFPRHILRYRNQRWAERIGLGELDEAEWERHFARFEPLADNLREPLSMRYHGHQFMAYNPYLGDGRAFLFAELRDCEDGRLLDLGTKGSGQTPWSRGGDGRLTLKGGVREVLATEALEALGVYTSKSLSLFETGESLYREDEPSPTRAAVLVRLSHSLVRFGTFQRLAYHDDGERMKLLLGYCVDHYFPHLAKERPDLPAAFFGEVARRAAELSASWMVAGFAHGVLNSDNMNITGESFDYGPYRFLPTYDPGFVAAYFDHGGLYAFGRQPVAVKWALACLAEALTLIAAPNELRPAYDDFEVTYPSALRGRLLERLNLVPRGGDSDGDLVSAAFDVLAQRDVGFEQFFFDWYGGVASEARALSGPQAGRYRDEPFSIFRQILERYSPSDPLRIADRYFRRRSPCTLLIGEVEAIWSAIAERDDWMPFEAKIAEIREMGRAYGTKPAPIRSTKLSQ